MITVRERQKRNDKPSELSGRRINRVSAGKIITQPCGELAATTLSPAVVRQRSPCHSVQPQTRAVARRRILKPAPGDQEGLGNHVSRIIRTC